MKPPDIVYTAKRGIKNKIKRSCQKQSKQNKKQPGEKGLYILFRTPGQSVPRPPGWGAGSACRCSTREGEAHHVLEGGGGAGGDGSSSAELGAQGTPLLKLLLHQPGLPHLRAAWLGRDQARAGAEAQQLPLRERGPQSPQSSVSTWAECALQWAPAPESGHPKSPRQNPLLAEVVRAAALSADSWSVLRPGNLGGASKPASRSAQREGPWARLPALRPSRPTSPVLPASAVQSPSPASLCCPEPLLERLGVAGTVQEE